MPRRTGRDPLAASPRPGPHVMRRANGPGPPVGPGPFVDGSSRRSALLLAPLVGSGPVDAVVQLVGEATFFDLVSEAALGDPIEPFADVRGHLLQPVLRLLHHLLRRF